jgi:alpha/beta hydrolase fold
MSTTSNDPVVSSYAQAPTRTISARGVTYAYRELGPKGGTPVVFFVHLAATLDNWDSRIVDPIAKDHHVITFDNRGVGASSGEVPDTIEAMADDAVTFINALGFDKVDIFSFSLGGMVAQALVAKHPELVRRDREKSERQGRPWASKRTRTRIGGATERTIHHESIYPGSLWEQGRAAGGRGR